jgi:dTDP-glucose pyrophosphorylase
LNQKTSGVVLTAAKADITICEVFGHLPTGLIPVNGKPIIFFILEQMFEQDIKTVYIGIDYKQDLIKEIINLYFKDKLIINFVYTDKLKSPGDSLLTILKKIKNGKVVINLGDTYIKGINLTTLNDNIIVSSDFLDEERWSTVEIENNSIKNFSDKERVLSENIYALCGLYILSDVKKINDFFLDNKPIQINDLLKYYINKINNLNIIKTNNWLDFGHIDKYYISKKRLIQSRGFNSLEYDDLLGTITKKSKNKEKFIEEIKWQINLPKSLKVLSPRVLNYSTGNNPFITMEFYSYPTLSEIWLFSELNKRVYFSIIDRLFKILELFKNNKQEVSKNSYSNIYLDKTIQRISEIKNKDILDLMKRETLIINGSTCNNWSVIKDKIVENLNKLYNTEDNCLIHGDFCLSNILYDLRSGIVRLIDPRGGWGGSENGDIKYDIAKLKHSITGDYDYIVNDLFIIEVGEMNISYTVYNSDKEEIKNYLLKKISQHYNLEQIELIEGLLFLSMISLHKDNPKRQLIMYSKAIELLNKV